MDCRKCGKTYCSGYIFFEECGFDCPDDFLILQDKKRSRGRNCFNCIQKQNGCLLIKDTKGKPCIHHYFSFEELEADGGAIFLTEKGKQLAENIVKDIT